MKKQIVTMRLKNGLEISLSPDKSAKSICVYVAIPAGPKYEDPETFGLAHFLEHMLFEGTEIFPTSRNLSDYIENIGGISGAWTDKEFVTYYVKIPTGKLEHGLNYLSQILFKPLLTNESIEKEKRIITEELNRTNDNPEASIWEHGMEEAWSHKNYLSRSTLGETKDIQEVSQGKLKNYLDKLYFPGNMRMAIVGNFPVISAKELIPRFFSSNKIQEVPKGQKVTLRRKKNRVKIINIKSSQTQILLGFTSKVGSLHKDYYKMKLIGDILGLGVSSRLFHGLVYDLGIAYSVGSGFLPYKDCGMLYVAGGLSSKKIELALRFILREFKKIKMEEISTTELQNVKQKAQAFINFSIETPDGVAKLYAEQMIIEGKITTPEQIVKKIDKITPEDVLCATKEYLDFRNLFLVIRGNIKIGQKRNIEKLMQEFNL